MRLSGCGFLVACVTRHEVHVLLRKRGRGPETARQWSAVLLSLLVLIAASGCGERRSATTVNVGRGFVDALVNSPFDGRIHPAVATVDSNLILFGGATDTPDGTTYHTDGTWFSPSDGEWQDTAALPFRPPVSSPAAVGLQGRSALVVGTPCAGNEPADPLVYCGPGGLVYSVYDLDQDVWTAPRVIEPFVEGATEPRALGAVAIGSTEDAAYFRLLDSTPGRSRDEVWEYDTSTERWTQVPTSPIEPDEYCLIDRELVAAATSSQLSLDAAQQPNGRDGVSVTLPDPEVRRRTVLATWDDTEWSEPVEAPYKGPLPPAATVSCAIGAIYFTAGLESVQRFDVSAQAWDELALPEGIGASRVVPVSETDVALVSSGFLYKIEDREVGPLLGEVPSLQEASTRVLLAGSLAVAISLDRLSVQVVPSS